MLIHLIVMIVSQCIHVSKHHKTCTFLPISCASVKLEKNKVSENDNCPPNVEGILMYSRDFSKIFTCKCLITIDIGLPRWR